MALRTALLLSFLVGTVIGAAALWLFGDSARPSASLTPRRASEVETPGPVTTGSDRGSTPRTLETSSKPRAERKKAARLTVKSESGRAAQRKPVSDYGGPARVRKTGFDAERLRASGFSSRDIDWIRRRWEDAEIEKRNLAELEALGEDPPRGGEMSDIKRELREDLGDNGYDAMLYATHQSNRVMLENVRVGGIADRAGLGNGTVLWSYDGQRVFDSKELAVLSTSGKRGEPVEIVILTDDGTEKLFIERNPIGAELVSAKQPPDPN